MNLRPRFHQVVGRRVPTIDNGIIVVYCLRNRSSFCNKGGLLKAFEQQNRHALFACTTTHTLFATYRAKRTDNRRDNVMMGERERKSVVPKRQTSQHLFILYMFLYVHSDLPKVFKSATQHRLLMAISPHYLLGRCERSIESQFHMPCCQ